MKSFIIIFISLIFSVTTHAAFLIEPLAGLNLGDASPGSTDYSYSSPQIGARAGYTSFGLMLGLDYRKTLEYDRENDSNNTETKFENDQFGAFVGYQLPVLFRLWGTYYMSSNRDNQVNSNTLKGSGYGLGVGYTGFPFLSLNLEYISRSHDERENSNGTTVAINDFDSTDIVLSISLPLSF